MSSDCALVVIQETAGPVVDLLCFTSSAGGPNDLFCTRSFALQFLEGTGGSRRLSSLLAALDYDTNDEQWHERHVSEFIARTELLARYDVVAGDDDWRTRVAAAMDLLDAGAPLEDLIAAHHPHRWLLRVTMTDARLLEGIVPGQRFGTTAYDVWWNDPTRPRD